MSELEIIETALENLKKETGFMGKWVQETNPFFDGKLTLTIGKEKIFFFTKVKKELRISQVPEVLRQLNGLAPALVVAGRLLPKIKEELRQHQIAYLEANGNFFYRTDNTWIFLDAHSPISFRQNVKNRAFTKTGLKVLFEILQNPDLLQMPYRSIASMTQTSVGNVANVLNGLKQDGFLMPLRKNEWILQKKESLISKWAEAYVDVLRPSLKVGRFRFLGPDTRWNDLLLKPGKSFWGGEPGADILTHYLKPAEFTMYTDESRQELIKNYRLVPDEMGDISIYKKFWQPDKNHTAAAPALVVYADLIASSNSRCIETATRILNDFLQD